MGDLGYLALAGALLLAAFAALASLLGAVSGRAELQESGWRALLGACALVVGAALTLVLAFQFHDFSLRYVAENSSTLMTPIDILASFWGGQAGSLLFWTTGLAVSSALCVTLYRQRYPELIPWAAVTLAGILVFLLGILVFMTNPFERLP